MIDILEKKYKKSYNYAPKKDGKTDVSRIIRRKTKEFLREYTR